MQVSLITCTNNSDRTIRNCCMSIFSQTYLNLEHIIIDNNSNDNTLDILNKSQINNQNHKLVKFDYSYTIIIC